MSPEEQDNTELRLNMMEIRADLSALKTDNRQLRAQLRELTKCIEDFKIQYLPVLRENKEARDFWAERRKEWLTSGIKVTVITALAALGAWLAIGLKQTFKQWLN